MDNRRKHRDEGEFEIKCTASHLGTMQDVCIMHHVINYLMPLEMACQILEQYWNFCSSIPYNGWYFTLMQVPLLQVQVKDK